MDELVETMDVLSTRAAADVLDDLRRAVQEGQELSFNQAVALAFIAGVEVGAVGLTGRTEYALKAEDFRSAATGSLIDTGRQLADRVIEDMIGQATGSRNVR